MRNPVTERSDGVTTETLDRDGRQVVRKNDRRGLPSGPRRIRRKHRVVPNTYLVEIDGDPNKIAKLSVGQRELFWSYPRSYWNLDDPETPWVAVDHDTVDEGARTLVETLRQAERTPTWRDDYDPTPPPDDGRGVRVYRGRSDGSWQQVAGGYSVTELNPISGRDVGAL
jgi:hypothetical protein